MGQTDLFYKGIHFDSDEEVFFAYWLQELKDAGYITRWSKNELPVPLTSGLKTEYIKKTLLKTKVKYEKKTVTILRPSEYTPDFIINFTAKGIEKFVGSLDSNFRPNKLFYKNTPGVVVEVKPAFDENNMTRLFTLNQKFLWERDKIFVNLVEPIELFKKTFMPALAMPYFQYIKNYNSKKKGLKLKGDWKTDYKPKTIKEYLNEHTNS